MIVTESTATVYHGADRRYFSKNAAYRSFARAAIKAVCECEACEVTGFTMVCHYHKPENYPKYIARLEGFYRQRDAS